MNLFSKLLNNQKHQDLIESINKLIEKIKEYEINIQNELKQCEKISKHEDTIKLLNVWKTEFIDISIKKETIDSQLKELMEFENTSQIGKYKNLAEIIQPDLEYLMNLMKSFFEKINNYTEFERENKRIALALKDDSKEINQIFDQNLKLLDVYNDSFLECFSDINFMINEFEDLHIKGDYVKARNILKNAKKTIESLQNNLDVLINYNNQSLLFHETLTKYEKKIEEIKEKEYVKYYPKVIKEIKKLKKEAKNNEDNLYKIKISPNYFNNEIETYETQFIVFKENFEIIIDKLDVDFKIIENIDEIKIKNENSIKVSQELLDGALEEKEVIEKLYNLTNIEQLTKIEKEKEIFDKFVLDYEKLLKIIQDKDSFENSEQKIIQSNKYLNRFLSNIKESIKALEAIRSDEVQIIENLDKYKKVNIRMKLYLKKYDHEDKMSSELKISLEEIDEKLKELEKALNPSPLDILYIRNLDSILTKLYGNTIELMERDIKQKIGGQRLIIYFNRFVLKEELFKYHQHFITLYNSNQHKQVIKEIHRKLVELNPNGEILYKNIVSTVEIDNFSKGI